MSIIKNHKKSVTAALGTAAAAVAAPAMLFVGAGTAHANGLVFNTPDPFGTTVNIVSDGTMSGNCTYNAVPVIGPGIPSGPRHFIMSPAAGLVPEKLWFPGVRLNTTWNVTVNCEKGTPINTTTVY